MILMMLSMALLGLTGYLMQEVDALWGAEWPEDAHRWIANGLALLVSLHVAAAVFESLRVRDNLPLSMITGRRRPLPGDDEPQAAGRPAASAKETPGWPGLRRRAGFPGGRPHPGVP